MESRSPRASSAWPLRCQTGPDRIAGVLPLVLLEWTQADRNRCNRLVAGVRIGPPLPDQGFEQPGQVLEFSHKRGPSGGPRQHAPDLAIAALGPGQLSLQHAALGRVDRKAIAGHSVRQQLAQLTEARRHRHQRVEIRLRRGVLQTGALPFPRQVEGALIQGLQLAEGLLQLALAALLQSFCGQTAVALRQLPVALVRRQPLLQVRMIAEASALHLLSEAQQQIQIGLERRLAGRGGSGRGVAGIRCLAMVRTGCGSSGHRSG